MRIDGSYEWMTRMDEAEGVEMVYQRRQCGRGLLYLYCTTTHLQEGNWVSLHKARKRYRVQVDANEF